MKEKKKFNTRAFISLVTLFLSIAVLISGIMLLLMPDPTLAYWNRWSFIGLEKVDWEELHAITSIFFTIIVVFHIIKNIKPMLSYMKSKAGEEFKNKKELMVASVLSAFLILGSSFNTPLKEILEVFEPAQEAWYSKTDEPPFEDAQALPLNMLAKLQGFELEKITEVFNKHGIKFVSFDEVLEEIAEENDVSSRKLYLMIEEVYGK